MDPQQNSNGQSGGQPQQFGQNQQVPEATPQIVYMTRPHDPVKPPLSEDQLKRHEESKRKYPFLNLSEGEFVISAVARHPIGLLQIWAVAGLVLLLIFGAVFLLSGGGSNSAVPGAQQAVSPQLLAIPAVLLAALTLLFAFIATSIYNANKFFLTNESVIQQIQEGLFAKREQTVSLANIEDASFNQHGIMPHLFNYGLLRLSTEGDETTYRFSYASRPQKQIAILNNAVEAFKNGRPVNGDD